MAPPSGTSAATARFIAEQIAEAITRAIGSTGTSRTGPPQEPRNCTYKQFLSCKPSNFTGTEGAVGLLRWFEKMESVFRISNCPEEYKVKYSTCTLSDKALTWWNSRARTLGTEAAYALSWEDLKQMMINEYCPRNEVQKLEAEFWDLKVIDNDVTKYTDRFLELSNLCPSMVTPEFKQVERYIWGLAQPVQGLVTTSEPETIQKAVRLAHKLNDQYLRQLKAMEDNTNGGKRKAECLENNTCPVPINFYPLITSPSTQRTHNPPSRAAQRIYQGKNPQCHTCQYHHPPNIPCRKCTICGRFGHLSDICRFKPQAKQP